MALTAAQLQAVLTLDKSQFDRELSSAHTSMQKESRGFKQWGTDVAGAVNDGIVLAATGAAGLATTIGAVGVQYNSLQQSSRAALETIMGGGEAANEQMDKLDEFASTSPFSKDVFIKAQQQLLGFGQEAERVVPTLDAIQNAVAATGGSNEDIAELTRIIAQLEGGVKLSAETLNQFGARGIDAATLIGDSMGKTGEQIRTEITKGTLDADQAIVALTDGMTERFGGAADNIKEQWDGATDRIKAATRDIGAEIARPFVDPNGGGRAVDWANDFADVLRAVEDQLPGMVSVLDDRLSPAFDTMRVSMKDAVDVINSWDAENFSTILDELGNHAPGIAGLSTAMFVMATSNIPMIGGLTSALGPLPAAIGAAALASPEMRDGLADIYEAGEPLIGVLGDLAGLASGTFSAGLETAGDVLGVVADVIGPVVEWFSELPEPVRNAATAAMIFSAVRGPVTGALGGMTEHLRNFGGRVGTTMDSFGGWASTFEGATNSTGDFRAAVSLAAGDLGQRATSGFRGAVNGIMGIFGGPWGIALMGATTMITYWAQQQAEAKAQADELRNSLNEQTGAFTENSDEIILNALRNEELSTNRDDLIERAEKLGISLQDLTGYIKGEGDATESVISTLDEYDNQHGLIVDAHGRGVYASDEFRGALDGVKNSTQEVVEQEKTRISELEELDDALDDTKRAQENFTEATTIAADQTKTMDERVRGLKDALDILNGVQKSGEEAARDLYDSNEDLGEFISGLADESDGLATGLFDVEEGMIAINTEGNQLNTMLESHETDMLAAAQAAYDKAGGDQNAAEAAQAAADAYDGQVDKLRDVFLESGMAEEEVDALIGTMRRTPDEINFVMSSGGSIHDTEIELIELANTIRATPDKDIDITDNSPATIARLEELGIEVKTLPDGRVVVEAENTKEAAQQIRDDVVNQNYRATVSVDVDVAGARGQLERGLMRFDDGSRSGGRGILAPRYAGGLDRFKGMAEGGFSVMDFAQMVSPGDIRFAGDRSDVDEAWIPLDGSTRSIAILEEAMRRMPGFEAEGMRDGGITGTVTPPEVEGVEAPDTAELQSIWAEAMQALESSTRSSFETIETDTAASQEATTANTLAQTSMMRQIMGDQLALMVGSTELNMAAMEATTGQHTTNMRTLAGAEFQAMQTDGTTQANTLRANTAAQFLDMQTVGTSQANLLRSNAAYQFAVMQADGSHEAAMLRYNSNTEFNDLQLHGVTAAGNLRAGVVSEIGAARTPFTGHVNDLVRVMRQFSDAMTDAYGDLGVTVGKPSTISMWTGGILPGYTPGTDVHSFHSPTGGRLDLSGGEGVSRPEVVQAMGPGYFNALNFAARSGGVAGVQRMLDASMPHQAFADGGIIDGFTADAKAIGAEYADKLPTNWLRPAGRSIIHDVVAGIEDHLATFLSGDGWVRPTTGRVTSRYGAGRGAYPHAGMDIADGHGTPTVAPTAGRVLETGWNLGPGRTGIGALVEHIGGLYSYYGHNPVGGLHVSPGDLLAPGDRIGGQGNTGNSTGAHLHWEIHKNSPWNDINPHPYWDAAGGGAGIGGLLPTGGNDMWSGIINQALGLAGLPQTAAYIGAWLRQGQSESGLNPRAVQQVHDINSVMGNHARGIVQTIPPTFAAYSLPGMTDIFNPLHNFTAGMRYAKSRYGAAGMLGVIGHGHGYEHGTDSALPGWAWVGEAGPELVNFSGGEKVMPHRESVAAAGGRMLTQAEADMIGKSMAKHLPRSAEININHPVTRDTDELARKSAEAFRETLISSSWAL